MTVPDSVALSIDRVDYPSHLPKGCGLDRQHRMSYAARRSQCRKSTDEDLLIRVHTSHTSSNGFLQSILEHYHISSILQRDSGAGGFIAHFSYLDCFALDLTSFRERHAAQYQTWLLSLDKNISQTWNDQL